MTVPSKEFPLLWPAIDSTRHAPRDIVLDDGCHDLGANTLNVTHALRLKAANGSTAASRSGLREWKARLRGSWDLDGTPQGGETGEFEDLSLENQRSPAQPDMSVCVMEVIGGTWAMTRCQIAGAGTGYHFCAIVNIGGEAAVQPADSTLRGCNSPILTLQECRVRALAADEIEVQSLFPLPRFPTNSAPTLACTNVCVYQLQPDNEQEVEHLIFVGGNFLSLARSFTP